MTSEVSKSFQKSLACTIIVKKKQMEKSKLANAIFSSSSEVCITAHKSLQASMNSIRKIISVDFKLETEGTIC